MYILFWKFPFWISSHLCICINYLDNSVKLLLESGWHDEILDAALIRFDDFMSGLFLYPPFLWVCNVLPFGVFQIPVSVGVSLYEAVSLYKGRRVIASKGEEGTNWKVHQLVLYCCCGILAGIVGGLLGLGGGFILGPLFLELGIPPQVCTALSFRCDCLYLLWYYFKYCHQFSCCQWISRTFPDMNVITVVCHFLLKYDCSCLEVLPTWLELSTKTSNLLPL